MAERMHINEFQAITADMSIGESAGLAAFVGKKYMYRAEWEQSWVAFKNRDRIDGTDDTIEEILYVGDSTVVTEKDAKGNITKVTEKNTAGKVNKTTELTYDAQGMLLTVKETVPTGSVTYDVSDPTNIKVITSPK